MKNLSNKFLLLTLAFILTGCATIVLTPSQKVGISSMPAGAEVTDNGNFLGKTPIVADLKRKDTHIIKIQLQGYQPYEIALSQKASGWLLGNILFGGIPGIIIDAMTGSIYVLSPEQIQIELKKNTISSFYEKDKLFITAVMKANPDWGKIGQLQKNK